MVDSLVSNLYDKNAELIEQLYMKLVDEKRRIDGQLDTELFIANPISPLNYNLMLHCASNFSRR